MNSKRTIFLTLLGINACAFFMTTLSSYMMPNTRQLEVQQDFSQQTNTYSFDDPFVAHYLLQKLDIFEAVQDRPILYTNYSSTAGGFKINNNYCDDHRNYFISNPQEIFVEKKFMSNYWTNNKIRAQVIPRIGQDLHPDVSPYKPEHLRVQHIIDMRLDINLFFTYNLFYYFRQPGTQFSCLTQASNHIPGHDKLYRKDYVGQALVDFAKIYETRPTCFNFDKYFPKTWMLRDESQCLIFFEEFNSPYYQELKEERNVVYFRKIGADVHEGQGVFPVTDAEEINIRNIYKNGTLCGKVKFNNLIQYNVYNPLLVKNRKFGFRSFMLVASSNPVIAYYHDGYLRLSLDEYNAQSKDIKTFVTNIGVNLKEAAKDTEFKGLTNQQIQDRTTWFGEQLQEYLLEEGIISDPNWLDNYLRPEFKKVMIHLVRMSQDAFFKKSSVFELYGLDFVMDDNLQLWFIEANTMPLIDGFTKDSTVLMNRMLEDTFEIIFGLLRSRTKRIIDYVNVLTNKLSKNFMSKLEIEDLSERRREFAELTKNKFEPQFEVRAENTFQKIIDENEYGVKRYSGLLERACL